VAVLPRKNVIKHGTLTFGKMKDKHQKYFQALGKNLQNLRKTKGLSQQELANRCDVDRAKISSIETAKEDFVMTTLLEIAEALEVDPREILDIQLFLKKKLTPQISKRKETFPLTIVGKLISMVLIRKMPHFLVTAVCARRPLPKTKHYGKKHYQGNLCPFTTRGIGCNSRYLSPEQAQTTSFKL
jgi:transcriptional regulator with XRE-family HTH domain